MTSLVFVDKPAGVLSSFSEDLRKDAMENRHRLSVLNFQDLSIPEGFKLMSNHLETEFHLIKDNSDMISIGIIKLKKLSCNLEGRNPCAQVLIWQNSRDEFKSALKWFGDFLIEYLLEGFTLIVADNQLTPINNQFWELQIIKWFNSKNIQVFVSEDTAKDSDLVRPLRLMTSLHGFLPTWVEYYVGPYLDLLPVKLVVFSKK